MNTKNVHVRVTMIALLGAGVSIGSGRVADAADPVATGRTRVAGNTSAVGDMPEIRLRACGVL